MEERPDEELSKGSGSLDESERDVLDVKFEVSWDTRVEVWSICS